MLLQLGAFALTSISDTLTQIGQFASLALILIAFVILGALAIRKKTTRSFQFEMFIFVLILAISEIPRIVEMSLGLQFPTGDFYGLVVHTVSMVVLAGFVLMRTFRFMKKNS